ncbi:MAG: pantoate--beta-alanine ligase [Acidobacteriota bacterium]
MRIVHDVADLRHQIDAWRASGERIALVPTMGALHDGHLSLVRRAAEHADRCVATVFVNPTQFDDASDLERYPRTLERDAEQLTTVGCDLLFAPAASTVYPPGASTWIDVDGPTTGYEGAMRPGHFRGVATVVGLLFNLVRPDVAIFGRKDAQQLAVVRKLSRDLHLGIEIIGAPIVREPDGLAMSSRNVHLGSDDRLAARALSRGLRAARDAIQAGERDSATLEAHVRAVLEAEPRVEAIDYIALVDADTFAPLVTARGSIALVLAARVGGVRLLDNLSIDLDAAVLEDDLPREDDLSREDLGTDVSTPISQIATA